MNKALALSILCILSLNLLYGHEGHKAKDEFIPKKIENLAQSICQISNLFRYNLGHIQMLTVGQHEKEAKSWAKWVGGFHFIFLHFPIALITMTVFSDLFFVVSKYPLFENSSRFMLIAAAFFGLPTAILGLTERFTSSYHGLLADFIEWHMWFGFATAFFTIFVAYLLESRGRSPLYYACVILLFLMVTVTGYLGGGMTFGPYQLIPPVQA